MSSPTPHSLVSQLFVKIWTRGASRWAFLHLTQTNVGFAISTQNHLQNTTDQELFYPQIIAVSKKSKKHYLINA